MHRNQGEVAVRRILGVLSLAKKYGVAIRRRCLRHGSGNRRAANITSSAATWNTIPQLPLSLRQVDPLIRQLTLYRDLIEARTQDSNLQENHT